MIPNKEEKIFVDCGAPSLYNKLSRKNKGAHIGASFRKRKYDDFSYTETAEYLTYRDNYAEFIKKHSDRINIYSNLDVVHNPKLSKKNLKYLEKKGINPAPVFHIGSDLKYLKEMVGKYEYICLGGLVGVAPQVIMPILDKVFKEILCDSDGFPKMKLHGFACTSLPLMLRYPWYSVDSTTSTKLGAYGNIFLPPVPGNPKLHIRRISDRVLKDEPKEFMLGDAGKQALGKPALPKTVLRQVEEECERLGFSLQQLKEDDNYRYYWNQLMMERVMREHSPNWPWSIKTGKAKGDDFINLYRAGSFKTKEEMVYRKQKDANNIGVNHRLYSFYYPKDLDKHFEFYKTYRDGKKTTKKGKRK